MVPKDVAPLVLCPGSGTSFSLMWPSWAHSKQSGQRPPRCILDRNKEPVGWEGGGESENGILEQESPAGPTAWPEEPGPGRKEGRVSTVFKAWPGAGQGNQGPEVEDGACRGHLCAHQGASRPVPPPSELPRAQLQALAQGSPTSQGSGGQRAGESTRPKPGSGFEGRWAPSVPHLRLLVPGHRPPGRCVAAECPLGGPGGDDVGQP